MIWSLDEMNAPTYPFLRDSWFAGSKSLVLHSIKNSCRNTNIRKGTKHSSESKLLETAKCLQH
jgi:hypothetical protein